MYIAAFKNQTPILVPHHYVHRHYILEKITQAICSNSDNYIPDEEHVSVTLVGTGGFGKTTLALGLCHHKDVKAVFKNGIIFIELGPQPCDPSNILNEHYCRMTGNTFEHIHNVEDKIKEVTRMFKDILVIIDDVCVVEDAKFIVKAFSDCKILLTTRNHDIGIPSRQTIFIGRMSLEESVSLMTNGILKFNELSKDDIKLIGELAQSTHQWPLLLSLVRGQLYHSLNRSNGAAKTAILDVQNKLTAKGLTKPFDINDAASNRLQSLRACIEVSLEFLDKSTKDKLLSLILYTGIGGSLQSQAVQCLWDVSNESAEKTISLLELSGLVYTRLSKPMPPFYNAAHIVLAVHGVISGYLINSITSEAVVNLSTSFFHTDRLIGALEERTFLPPHLSEKSDFLTNNKLRLEHIILPYYMKDINMHVLHDPHFALVVLHNIQLLFLSNSRNSHLLELFNEEIITLISECQNAISNAQFLSRKFNLHFQLCFRKLDFDDLTLILKEYLETHFIASTITRCIKLTESISTQCDDELKASMTEQHKDFQIITKEYHCITSEKLPQLQLFVSLHRRLTRALLQRNDAETEALCDYIRTGKLDKEVQLIRNNYLIKIQHGEF